MTLVLPPSSGPQVPPQFWSAAATSGSSFSAALPRNSLLGTDPPYPLRFSTPYPCCQTNLCHSHAPQAQRERSAGRWAAAPRPLSRPPPAPIPQSLAQFSPATPTLGTACARMSQACRAVSPEFDLGALYFCGPERCPAGWPSLTGAPCPRLATRSPGIALLLVPLCMPSALCRLCNRFVDHCMPLVTVECPETRMGSSERVAAPPTRMR